MQEKKNVLIPDGVITLNSNIRLRIRFRFELYLKPTSRKYINFISGLDFFQVR